MRPTSEAWPMSARVATARQPLESAKIAAGVTPGHPHDLSSRSHRCVYGRCVCKSPVALSWIFSGLGTTECNGIQPEPQLNGERPAGADVRPSPRACSGRNVGMLRTPCGPDHRRTSAIDVVGFYESCFELDNRGVRAAVVADGKATIGEANATNARSRADAVFGLLRTPAECYRSR